MYSSTHGLTKALNILVSNENATPTKMTLTVSHNILFLKLRLLKVAYS